MEDNFYIYALELEGGFYYVGKTADLTQRLSQHFNNKGSEWTKLHKPTGKFSHIITNDVHEENKQTLNLMKRFGISNVRGGSFCKIELDTATQNVIQNMIRSSEDQCFKCGGKGHFSANCENSVISSPPQQHEKQKVVNNNNNNKCTVCSRHWIKSAEMPQNECVFCRHIFNEIYEDEFKICAICYRKNHRHKNCYATYDCDGNIIKRTVTLKEYEKVNNCCGKCGRSGHRHKSCYAKTDNYGNKFTL